jgi:hypothetical protein
MPTSPARRRFLLLVTVVVAIGAFLGPWGASPETVPTAESDAPEPVQSSEAPAPCTLRSPRRTTTPFERLATPIEEWFVLRGQRKEVTTVLEPWFAERVAEPVEPATTPAPDLLDIAKSESWQQTALRHFSHLQKAADAPEPNPELNSGGYALFASPGLEADSRRISIEVLNETLTTAVRRTGTVVLLANVLIDSASHRITFTSFAPFEDEVRPGLERRTFDVRHLGVRAPDDDESEDEGEWRITPPPFLGNDTLASLVRSSVVPPSWTATGASAEVANGTLVAWNKSEHLDAVAEFLLRLDERLAPQIEAHVKAFAQNNRAFDVADFLAGDAPAPGRLAPEGLRAVVTSQVDPVSWLGEGRIEVRDGLLVVRNSPENLEAVERLLARLRTALPGTTGAAKPSTDDE